MISVCLQQISRIAETWLDVIQAVVILKEKWFCFESNRKSRFVNHISNLFKGRKLEVFSVTFWQIT